jgi:cyclopropane-fatty-acyl-phospholipid synthase
MHQIASQNVDSVETPVEEHRGLATLSIPPVLESVLGAADVRLGGDRPWDLQPQSTEAARSLVAAVLERGSLGLGNCYVEGLWECTALDQLFTRLLLAQGDCRLARGSWLRSGASLLRERLLNLQSPERSTLVARRHYDIAPPVYGAMLDPWWQYSCGYWQHANGLAEAQEHKLQLICEKLELRSGQRLLDIGCGWGGLAAFAAQHYGVEVVGITLSAEQLRLARSLWSNLPVRFERCDYRQLQQLGCAPFDRLVSVGMFEHVGPRNAGAFFAAARSALRDDGLFLLHTIGYRCHSPHCDPWIDTHVFPNGRLPAPGELAGALERDWLIEDWQNFGSDYDHTLMAWHANVESAWPQLAPQLGGHAEAERFRRFWRYYLLCCAGFFRSRQGQLWQLVLSKSDLARAPRRAPYRSIRVGPCPLASFRKPGMVRTAHPGGAQQEIWEQQQPPHRSMKALRSDQPR